MNNNFVCLGIAILIFVCGYVVGNINGFIEGYSVVIVKDYIK